MSGYLRRTGPIAAAIGLYAVWGLLLIAQKPGLQDDEALLVAGAVHMQHSATTFELQAAPDAWTCAFPRCIPVMSAYYVGAVKDYLCLPLFAMFGARTPIIRLVSLLLSALGIWGIYWLVAAWFDRRAATLTAFIIAMNPAFANMTIFDNNAVGVLMAGLGLTCAAIAFYYRRHSVASAFAVGLAMGFGVWARANFAWVLIAGTAAAIVVYGRVYRRRLLIPLSHLGAIVTGGIVGGLPFLVYQVISGGATWKVQQALRVPDPMMTLLRNRSMWFADMLLSDGEHRVMWAGAPLPAWQMWFFPIIVIAACVVCLIPLAQADERRRSSERFFVLTFLFLAASLFFSRLPVSEHHLIILLPLAVVIVVLGCSIIQQRHRLLGAACAILLLVYGASALYWQVETIRGLRSTGGVGVWSDAGLDLARYLDQHYGGRQIKILDWGLQFNQYVLTSGRLQAKEIYSGTSEGVSAEGRPWIDEIREGGVFLLNGPDNRQFPKPSRGFLKVLAEARPVMQTHNVTQRNGAVYAQVIEIMPDSLRGQTESGQTLSNEISMGDPASSSQLRGFYSPEDGGFRWTQRQFSVLLGRAQGDTNRLVMRLYIPDIVIRKLGSVTMNGQFNGHALAPESWSHPGQYVFRRDLDPAWVRQGTMSEGIFRAEFSLNKALQPTGADRRELGIIVREIAIEAR